MIFITENDVLGRGLPVYHVERCVLECDELFRDGAHILYANGAYRGDSPIGKLMHDFSCSKPSEMHYDVLANRAKFFKESEKGVTTMCKAIEELNKTAFEEGREEGREERSINIARELLKIGEMKPESIAQVTCLPLEKVLALC